MRIIPKVVEDIKSILNNIERTEECTGETLVDINELVDEILSIDASKQKIVFTTTRNPYMPDFVSNFKSKLYEDAEEAAKKKRMIDVDTWIDKLAKIISDPEAPGEYKDYCMHLVDEIETEFRAQEVQAIKEGE